MKGMQYLTLFLVCAIVVPIESRYEPWWVPERGHNDILVDNEPEYFRWDYLQHYLYIFKNITSDNFLFW